MRPAPRTLASAVAALAVAMAAAAAAVFAVVPTARARGALPAVARTTARARGALPAARAGGHRARAARTVSLNETGHLHLTSKHNFTLNEEGSASGTAPGTIYVHLTAVSSTRVTAEVDIYPRGGSIVGYGTGSYRRTSTAAQFSGSMSIERGSGSYAHISGSGLSFSGTIAESAGDAITVKVSGRVSD
jgi:hypothetical protein